MIDHARRSPEALAYSFLGDGERETARLTYGELEQRARAIAERLRDAGVTGEPVLLLYPPGLDYVTGFLGCLYAGAVAVPLYPPDPARVSRTLPRLAAVVADSRARVALTTSAIENLIEAHLPAAAELRELRWLATDVGERATGAPGDLVLPGQDLAYLQYTSGSTGNPKGVMVGHRNLLDNCAAIAKAWQVDEHSRMVSWLPLFHDMGLIAGMLLPLYLGFPVQLMSPVEFVRKPVRWLRAIDDFGATISGAPNFAFDLCVNKVSDADRDTLDLSRWRTAFNAAEPVRAATLRRFTSAFSWSGFRRETFYPSYGLAEATLIVSAGKPAPAARIMRVDAEQLSEGRLVAADEKSGSVRELVSCGTAVDSGEMAIVDPATREVRADGEIGEVWVRGPAVAHGYRDHPAETEAVFGAYTGTGQGPYLRTGDLGFLRDGELYLAARHKDLIIIRGRNYFPQDIEQAAERSDPLLRPGCVAAFASEDDERVVILQEVREEAEPERYAEAIRAIRLAVAEQCDVQPDEVALVARAELFKTSSGKIQRRLCRSRYDADALRVLASSVQDSGSPGGTESGSPDLGPRSVPEWLAEHHPRLAAEPDVPLVVLGLDSLRSVELAHDLETRFGVPVDQSVLLDGLTANGLADLLAGAEDKPETATVERTERTGRHGLSPGQRALWFLHRLAPESPAYNQIFAATVRSPLDVAALRTALGQLVRRHPILRTTYGERDGSPFQQVHADLPVELLHVDATDWTEAQVRSRLHDEVHRPFDLTRGPVLRTAVLGRPSGESVLLLCVQHIALDFWSLGILVDELATCYSAAVTGTSAELGPEPAGYLEHAARSSETASTDETHWAYWSRVLEDTPAVLDLPVARRRPPVFGNRGAAHTFTIGPGLSARAHEFARSEGVTLYTLLLAVFQTLLHRYSGQDDVLVGSPTSGRSEARFAETLGYFVNMIPLRADFSAAPTLRELLVSSRRNVLDGLAHQSLPFSELVDRLGVQRDASRSPLFDVAFLLQKSHRPDADQLVRFALGEPGARLRIGGLELESLGVEQDLARFDLELWIAQEGDELLGSLRYRTDLFTPEVAGQLMEHFEVLLDRALAAPDLPLDELPLLTAAQHQRMVHDWNDTATPYSDSTCLHELFEARVDSAPDAPAVVSERGVLTYADVETAANQIANRLLAEGAGRAEMVGVVLERGPEMVPALLGVLKAGCTYVPVEPDNPLPRTTETFTRLGVHRVLTNAAHARRLGELTGVTHVLAVDEPVSAPRHRPARRGDPADLAYVILTSGSTGVPKGVAVTHRPVVNTIEWVNGRYSVDADDRILFVTSLCFDLSVYDVFGMLATGGSIRVASSAELADPQRLLELLRHGGITFWDSAPAALTRLLPLLDAGDGAEPASALRLVFLSGDWIPVTMPGRITAAFPNAAVIGLGGATEAAIWSNFHEIVDVDPEWPSIPYGRPIQNARYYVLDRTGNPCPVGVPGELFIGGDCLASGYAGDPELSAEKFVPDPFGLRDDAKMYRTGDRARFTEDGTIEFLGRVDTMVKVRGYRIEPGEIESALARHPRVRDAAVVARGGRGEQRLVAYVTPAAGDQTGQLVGEWEQVFDDVYGRDVSGADPTFNTAGWIDGHTGLPFSDAEMREWVDDTVGRIQERVGTGATVLEIGCGTGLLLARVAPECAAYVGLDVSARALAHVRERVVPAVAGLTEVVELHQLAADELRRLAGRRFDLVVLNSVVQYFPDADYLARVLAEAATLLAPGGSIFIGDVRNLALERELRLSAQLHRAGQDGEQPPLGRLAELAAVESQRERELLVHPDLFAELCGRTAELQAATVLVKHGRHHNELNTFRYDVVLSTSDSPANAEVTAQWTGADLPGLAEDISAGAERKVSAVRITDIADARLVPVTALRELIDSGAAADSGSTAADLPAVAPAVDPAAVQRLPDLLPGGPSEWTVRACWPLSGTAGRFDLLAVRRGAAHPARRVEPTGRPWRDFTNVPVRPGKAGALVAMLREHLRSLVPEYMVPATIVVLPGGLPVTANGKLDRGALPEPDEPRAAVTTEFTAPRNPKEEVLAEIWCDVLGIERIGVHDRFFELGGDSILSIQVVSRAAQRGIRLAPRDLFQHQTVAELAAAAGSSAPAGPAGGDIVLAGDGEVPLTPAQHWFFDLGLSDPGHFNQSFLFAVRGEPLDTDRVERAVLATFGGHDALRMRFRHEAGTGWRQCLRDVEAVVVSRVDADHGAQSGRTWLDKIADEQNARLDLERGPLARVVLVHGPAGCDRLLITLHHLVVDGVSWWTLVDDLATEYSRLERGEPETEDTATGTAFAHWARALRQRAEADELRKQIPGWRRVLGAVPDALPRDIEADAGTGVEADACTVTRELTAEETDELLLRAGAAYRTHTDELLLAALVAAVHEWAGSTSVRVDLEGHGRDVLPELDVSRTVGWFTTFTPLLLDIGGLDADDPGRLLTAVKEQRRAVPGGPADFGLLRYPPSAAAAPGLDDLPAAEIGFNYLGRLDRIGGDRFRLVPGTGGAWRGQANRRPYLLEVNCQVVGGRFEVQFTHSESIHRHETVAGLADGFAHALRRLVAHCTAPGAGEYTPSDFPLAGLDQQSLAAVLGQFGGASKQAEGTDQ
ncbi:non-ribosomal peptide synthetase [Amycolatopsis marina]|uniref:non-ribosomal peptide synthetase n=1 Tax=Amycolatopsis marina TaxID=490629 RepID=UPI0015A51B11|nr:non-ribosomal peptide synthetase [Amycolatopsis marina]